MGRDGHNTLKTGTVPGVGQSAMGCVCPRGDAPSRKRVGVHPPRGMCISFYSRSEGGGKNKKPEHNRFFWFLLFVFL